jgi:hypothetical protein
VAGLAQARLNKGRQVVALLGCSAGRGFAHRDGYQLKGAALSTGRGQGRENCRQGGCRIAQWAVAPAQNVLNEQQQGCIAGRAGRGEAGPCHAAGPLPCGCSQGPVDVSPNFVRYASTCKP